MPSETKVGGLIFFLVSTKRKRARKKCKKRRKKIAIFCFKVFEEKKC
jgi:hypothetical protein